MKPKIDYTLYLVTDRELMSSPTIEESVEKAIIGGATLVQLREKNLSSGDFYNMAVKVKQITKEYNIPLIINDRVDIAIAIDAEGVHIGQDDLPLVKVREIIGEKKIIGVSASNLDEALLAKDGGADYLGIGAMYATNTKSDANITSIDELIKIRKSVEIPIVVIGGINRETVDNFRSMGIDGIAVISAIVAQKDVEYATREIKALFIRGDK